MRQLILQCLETRPSMRPSALQASNAFSHVIHHGRGMHVGWGRNRSCAILLQLAWLTAVGRIVQEPNYWEDYGWGSLNPKCIKV